MTTSNDQNLEFLIEAVAWQDSLLQAYRSLHITIQSIFLATAAGLLVAMISSETIIQTVIVLVILGVIWFLQRFISARFKDITLARGEDVNFWHRKVIVAEKNIAPHLRYFTDFKVFQKLKRDDSEYLQDVFLSTKEVSDEKIDTLITKGLGHTRRVIDQQLFSYISLIWWIFAIFSVIWTILKATGVTNQFG